MIVNPVYCRCYLIQDNKSINIINCKKCKHEINLNDFNYYCSNCNSTFCKCCYYYHRVIFENNIIIFDGNFENNKKEGYGITYKKNNEIKYSGIWVNGNLNLLNNIPHFSNFKRTIFDGNTLCHICHKVLDTTDEGINCNKCNLSICDKCIIKINNNLILANIHHGHSLTIIKYSKNIKCTICNREKNNIFFICPTCNEDRNKKKLFCCFECFKEGHVPREQIIHNQLLLPQRNHSRQQIDLCSSAIMTECIIY